MVLPALHQFSDAGRHCGSVGLALHGNNRACKSERNENSTGMCPTGRKPLDLIWVAANVKPVIFHFLLIVRSCAQTSQLPTELSISL
jgi:hypothetical protein